MSDPGSVQCGSTDIKPKDKEVGPAAVHRTVRCCCARLPCTSAAVRSQLPCPAVCSCRAQLLYAAAVPCAAAVHRAVCSCRVQGRAAAAVHSFMRSCRAQGRVQLPCTGPCAAAVPSCRALPLPSQLSCTASCRAQPAAGCSCCTQQLPRTASCRAQPSCYHAQPAAVRSCCRAPLPCAAAVHRCHAQLPRLRCRAQMP